MRLIRSIQFCCPRPASWSTKLDGYKTLQQPGCTRPLQSFYADHEIAAWASPSPRRFPGLQGAASTSRDWCRTCGVSLHGIITATGATFRSLWGSIQEKRR